MGVSKALKSAEEDDATSEKTLQLSAACSLYVNIVKVQGETQAIRNHIDENWAKRAATARDIESIQHQIHTGKVSDLKDHEAKLQAEMLQNQEKFAAEAAANEAASRLLANARPICEGSCRRTRQGRTAPERCYEQVERTPVQAHPGV
jgi:hypothetical protein